MSFNIGTWFIQLTSTVITGWIIKYQKPNKFSLYRTSVLLFTWIIWGSWAWRTASCWHPSVSHSPGLPGWSGGHCWTGPFQWQPGLCPTMRSAWVSPQTRPGQSSQAVSRIEGRKRRPVNVENATFQLAPLLTDPLHSLSMCWQGMLCHFNLFFYASCSYCYHFMCFGLTLGN